jgi:hypothetical protein
MKKQWQSLLLSGLIVLLLWPVAVAYAGPPAAPPLQTEPDESWWESFIPEEFLPGNIGRTVLETVWDLITAAIKDALNQWFQDTIGAALDWVTSHWDLKNTDGLLGWALDAMFSSAAMLVIPWISLSIIVTFFQKMLVTVFPGLVRNFSIGQSFGRLLIVIFFVNDYMKDALIDLTDGTTAMAFSMAMSGGAGGLLEWEWASNIMTLIMWGTLEVWQVIAALLGLIVLFILVAASIVLKHLVTFFLLAALPLAAVSWLYPFTEKFWSKFWWMYLKLLVLPFILAFGIKISLSILEMLGSSPLIGLFMALGFQMAIGWVLFKFLLMPETLLVGGGALLTAAGAGMIGVPMMLKGGSGYVSKLSGDKSGGGDGARMARQAGQAYQVYNATKDITGGGS